MLDVIVEYLHFISKNYKLFIYDNDRHELLEVTVKNTKIYWDLCKSEYMNTVICQYYLFGNILCDARDVDPFFMDMSLDKKKHTMLDLDHPETILIIKQRLLDKTVDFYYNEGKDDFIWRCTPCNTEPKPESEPETESNSSDDIDTEIMMSIINNECEVDLTKLMALQLFAKDGNLKITDTIKAKLVEKILKDIKSNRDLPIEMVALINKLDEGNLDLQTVIKYKILTSDNIDIEKMMLMKCIISGGDVTDILNYKLMLQLLKDAD